MGGGVYYTEHLTAHFLGTFKRRISWLTFMDNICEHVYEF